MKVSLQIEEKVQFQHEITIEVPDGTDIDKLLSQNVDKQIKRCGFSDVKYVLSKIKGIKILDSCEDDSGDISETEIIGFEEIN